MLPPLWLFDNWVWGICALNVSDFQPRGRCWTQFDSFSPLMTVRTERIRLRIWALTPGSSPKPPTPWSTPQPTAENTPEEKQPVRRWDVILTSPLPELRRRENNVRWEPEPEPYSPSGQLCLICLFAIKLYYRNIFDFFTIRDKKKRQLRKTMK